ncbi:MAG TPA: hypothetical protein VN258_19580 [Mobilitalea sp.]|nr:hypothetical protein [Mobilitalea sp.]
MSFEINVISLNQEKPISLPFQSDILLKNELEDEGFGRYHTIWPFMCGSKGVLYSLVVEMEEDYFSSFPICDSDFEAKSNHIPYWIEKDDIKDVLNPLIIFERYRNDFEQIIKFLINNSPIKTIMFQTRYQGGDHEIICGVLNYKEFSDLLDDKKILFNVCYLIRDEF